MREFWTAGDFVPLCSSDTSRELIRAMAYPKFGLKKEDIEVLLSAYLLYTEVVEVGSSEPQKLPLCRDPHDQMFLLLAGDGKAEVLVSGDRALLELSGKTPFQIETPAQFKRRFL
jgi:putative PIN family toxin of toxin-antitoxin system